MSDVKHKIEVGFVSDIEIDGTPSLLLFAILDQQGKQILDQENNYILDQNG